MSHEELNGLAAGYALWALDTDELREFEAHLSSCPECLASVAEMRPLIDALSLLSEPAQPPGELRERIMASIRTEPKTPVPSSRVEPEKKAPFWRRPMLWPLPVAVVITALAVAVALVSVWGSQTGSDLSTAQNRLDLTYDGLEIMAQADQWWRFDGAIIGPGMAGTLAYSANFDAACLLVWGLSEGDDFKYLARLTEANGAVTELRMWRYGNAMWLILDGDPNRLGKLEVMQITEGSVPGPGSQTLIEIPLTSS